MIDKKHKANSLRGATAERNTHHDYHYIHYHLDHRNDDDDDLDDNQLDDDNDDNLDDDQEPLDYPSVQGLDLAADCLVDCKPLIPPPAHQVLMINIIILIFMASPFQMSVIHYSVLFPQTGSLLWPELSHSKLGYGDLLSGRTLSTPSSSSPL